MLGLPAGHSRTSSPRSRKFLPGSELVNKFDMFDASKIKEGLVRIGGFEARGDLIRAGKSGELVRFNFAVIGRGIPELHLVRLKDDIASWGIKNVYGSRRK